MCSFRRECAIFKTDVGCDNLGDHNNIKGVGKEEPNILKKILKKFVTFLTINRLIRWLLRRWTNILYLPGYN